jgi:hypothetical protein
MIMLVLTFWIVSSQTTISNGSIAHRRKDGSMFFMIPFVGLAAIIPDPTEDSVTKLDENGEYLRVIIPDPLI